MGLFSFVKDAGAKLFGKEEEKATPVERSSALDRHIKRFNLRNEGISAKVDGSTVFLEGKVDTLQEKNRIVMAAGNIRGIDGVNDDKVELLEPVAVIPETQFYTVVSGDYLSKISKKVYGDANKYNVIFEANKPMLKDPDLIYPGQVLVIPALDKA